MKKRIAGILLLTICFIIGFNLWLGSEEMDTVKAATKGTVTTDGLRVRTKAGTDKEVLTYKGKNVMLSKGTEVTIKAHTEVKGTTWYRISFEYEGKTLDGYVSGEYVKTSTGQPITSTSISIPAKVTGTMLNVRKAPSTTASQLTVDKEKVAIKKGTSVTIRKEVFQGSNKWYYISFKYKNKTRKGYVLSDFVALKLSKKVTASVKSSSSVGIRTGAGDKKSYLKVSNKKVALKNGTSITITKEVTDTKNIKWFKIQFTYSKKTRTGYIPANKTILKKEGFSSSSSSTNTNTNTEVSEQKKGEVTTDGLRVRTAAGTDKKQLTYNGKNVTLYKGQTVTIKGSKKVDGVTWYKVSFTFEKKNLTGYVSGDYIKMINSSESEEPEPTKTPKPTETPKPTKTPEPTETPESTKTPEPTETPKPTKTPKPIDDIDAYLKKEGFPESYKSALKTLHKAHPNWIFKAHKTGLNWDTVIDKETKVGLNLISVNKADGWKSFEEGAYNFATDKFIPYDGSTWVTASKDAVKYYMDPRNFLLERGIFQFATLEYQSSYETKDGVEKILANTPLYNTKYSYKDDSGKSNSISYSNTFLDAAEESGVSPFHLATRVKQEVVTNSTSLSGSASGKYSGYEGYYNFYNIGATHSTAAGGAIINGLKYAKGLKSTASEKETYMLPWDNPYKAIVGGAKYIGKQYINRGQNTIYLQKFNVTNTSTYSHQYMANVEAANSEAVKLYNGYTSILDEALVFSIPIYENMPSSKCKIPGDVQNPNNWLKTLKIGSFTLTPKFEGSTTDYTLELKEEDSDTQKITVEAASSKASVQITYKSDGKTIDAANQDKITIASGSNVLTIKVTAENKDTKTYKVTITK